MLYVNDEGETNSDNVLSCWLGLICLIQGLMLLWGSSRIPNNLLKSENWMHRMTVACKWSIRFAMGILPAFVIIVCVFGIINN